MASTAPMRSSRTVAASVQRNRHWAIALRPLCKQTRFEIRSDDTQAIAHCLGNCADADADIANQTFSPILINHRERVMNRVQNRRSLQFQRTAMASAMSAIFL